MTAPEHAHRASQLLDLVERFQREVTELDPLERSIRLASMGEINADMQWMIDLATAHAHTAIALQATSEVPQQKGSPGP